MEAQRNAPLIYLFCYGGGEIMAGRQGFAVQQEFSILEDLEMLSKEIQFVYNSCNHLRRLLDEGTYKLDSILNIVNSVKTKEQEILTSGGDPVVLQQMNEEQIDNLLEMLKTPSFQKLARKLLTQWVNTGEN
jgi:organic radical activating enzyme